MLLPEQTYSVFCLLALTKKNCLWCFLLKFALVALSFRQCFFGLWRSLRTKGAPGGKLCFFYKAISPICVSVEHKAQSPLPLPSLRVLHPMTRSRGRVSKPLSRFPAPSSAPSHSPSVLFFIINSRYSQLFDVHSHPPLSPSPSIFLSLVLGFGNPEGLGVQYQSNS